MIRSIYVLFIIAFLIPVFSFSQYFTIDTIKGQSPYHKNISYIFPHITSLNNQIAAYQMNKVLVENILQIDSVEKPKCVFEKIWGDSNSSILRLSDISFEIINNDSLFFCIGISAEGCGANCEHWTRYFTFESKSGKGILLDELFSKDSMGLPLLLSSTKHVKNERINASISKLTASINDKNTSEEDKGYDSLALDIYTECKKYGGDSEYEGLNFSLSKNQIILYIDPCLPHMIRSLDDVDYTFVFDLKDIKYLNNYAKSVLKL